MTTPTSGAADLPEALRVPLDSLHADAGYLCGRLLNGSLTQEQVVKSIRRRIDAAKLAALTAQAISAEPAGAADEAEVVCAEAQQVDASPSAASIAWKALRDLTDPLDEAGTKIMGHVRVFAQRQYEAGRASHGQAPAQTADFTTLGAAMRAIQQAIGLIGDPADERMQAVRRVLRGAVVVAEDSGDIPAQPDCLTCNGHGAVGNILTAEPTPDEGFFLLLPKRPKPEAPANTVGLTWDAYSGAQMLAYGRECSDAARPAPPAMDGGEDAEQERPVQRMEGWTDTRYIAELENVARLLRRDLEKLHKVREALSDCSGGQPCSTCPDKKACQQGCVRQEEFISTEYHAQQRSRAAQQAPAGQAVAPATQPNVLPRGVIRDVFMAHGFTVKEGQTDLKEYVYDAAYALLDAARAAQKEKPHDL